MPSAPCVSSSATGSCVTCAGAGVSTTPTWTSSICCPSHIAGWMNSWLRPPCSPPIRYWPASARSSAPPWQACFLTACAAACAWKPATSTPWSRTRPRPPPTNTSMNAGPSLPTRTWKRPNTSSSPSAPNTGESLAQIWCLVVPARVCSKTSRPPNSGRTVRLHPRCPAGKTLNGLSSRSNCSRPRHITGTCTSSTWKGPLSAGASTPPAWTGCWSMRRRPLKTASTTSSSAASIWL